MNRISEGGDEPVLRMEAASAPVLDFEPLLRPISVEEPAGPDLRHHPSGRARFDAVKAARRRAADCERRIERGETSPSPNWGDVLDMAQSLTERDTKDLEIVAYLIEALVRERGFAGLRDGFQLAAELVERFWDNLHPRPDEEEPTLRGSALGQLSGADKPGTLIDPINRVPLTDAGAGTRRFSRLDFEQATELETLEGPKREARSREGWVSMETYRSAVAATAMEAFDRMSADVALCERAFARLCAALSERCRGIDGRDDSPPSSRVREALERCRMTLAHTMKWRGRNGTPSCGTAMEAPTVTMARQNAARSLRDVAATLRASEPHTPVIYLVEKAARWLDTPLPELLAELIDDAGAREMVFRLTGIPRPDAGAVNS